MCLLVLGHTLWDSNTTDHDHHNGGELLILPQFMFFFQFKTTFDVDEFCLDLVLEENTLNVEVEQHPFWLFSFTMLLPISPYRAVVV